MSKTTFAQLPGLQKAAKILELTERINTHSLYAAWLMDEFNIQHKYNRTERANRLQILCEWHATQIAFLRKELHMVENPL